MPEPTDRPESITNDDGDGDPTIEAPERSPNDEPITVRVTGATPGERVEWSATLVADDGAEWRSRATFAADDDGVVDLSAHAPVAGSYEGCEPMGWLWSMRAGENVEFPALGADPAFDVDLEARAGDASATRTVTRVLYPDGTTSRSVDRDDVVGTLYEPPGDGPHPAVLDLHGSAGRLSDRTAKLLTAHGYAVLAVTYFGDGDPLPDDHRRVPLEYFDAAVDWLRDRPRVAADRVGLVGVSRGAELALVLGERRDWVGAVVSYAGSGVPWDTPSGEPAWTDDGDPVPHVVADPVPGATVERGLDPDLVEDVAARVERTNGPILLLSGGADGVWQSRYLSEISVERLERHDFPHRFEHRTYDAVGHYVGTPYVPLSGVGDDETVRATARAGADSWPRVLDVLAIGLDHDGVTADR